MKVAGDRDQGQVAGDRGQEKEIAKHANWPNESERNVFVVFVLFGCFVISSVFPELVIGSEAADLRSEGSVMSGTRAAVSIQRKCWSG